MHSKPGESIQALQLTRKPLRHPIPTRDHWRVHAALVQPEPEQQNAVAPKEHVCFEIQKHPHLHRQTCGQGHPRLAAAAFEPIAQIPLAPSQSEAVPPPLPTSMTVVIHSWLVGSFVAPTLHDVRVAHCLMVLRCSMVAAIAFEATAAFVPSKDGTLRSQHFHQNVLYLMGERPRCQRFRRSGDVASGEILSCGCYGFQYFFGCSVDLGRNLGNHPDLGAEY
mmetsp:Transcript_1625/g.3476  ORF Transcript_1625/g.3476 Transcript_1625/m.3476 type:complete len:222 (-) Transcript_1625:759-1424(-)